MWYREDKRGAIPIEIVTIDGFNDWLKSQSERIVLWLQGIQFKLEPGNACLVPDDRGGVAFALCCLQSTQDHWNIGNLPMTLPEGLYQFSHDDFKQERALVWGLGAYQYTAYKKSKRKPATLSLDKETCKESIELVKASYLVRDLVNAPADAMGPEQLSQAAKDLADAFSVEFNELVGEELLQENYPSIYTVGCGSDKAPRLIELKSYKPGKFKLTLVGKGVTFDTGGLDIKPAPAMLLMKKDMGGAAHVLGLARLILALDLPISLRVLIPAVENAISGKAYRPGDVIKSRKGLTIEIGNTDAEGRVILADALFEAQGEAPDLLIDMATLTGAARVALGTELPALFSNNATLAQDVVAAGEAVQDFMWHMPLFQPYREYNKSNIADISNCGTEPYGGAITAALFLQSFVGDNVDWLHFDLMAWNLRGRPGRPKGAEAMAIRGLYHYLKQRVAEKKL